MNDRARQEAAGLLAEACATGAPLGALPDSLAPRTVGDGQQVAAAVLSILGVEACGIRMSRGPQGAAVAGPVLESRLLRDGAAIALDALRHATVSAAIVAVLGGDLDPDGDALPPVTLLPALDVVASRFTQPPGTDALLAADLGGHGLLVVGRPMQGPPGAVRVRLAPGRTRPAGADRELGEALAAAAAAARRLGGLPAGALLVAAGLSDPHGPRPGETLRAAFGALGRVRTAFV